MDDAPITVNADGVAEAVAVDLLLPGVSVRVEWGAEHRSGCSQAERKQVDRVWREMREQNDALYDGPIARVLSADIETGVVLCGRSTFKHLVTAGRLGRDVRQLGIVGWLIGMNRAGVEHVLLARRSSSTRVYPGMWENAPSGGVTAGEDERSLFRMLEDEAEEELGMALPSLASGRSAFVGWMRDPIARSLDLIVRVEVGEVDPSRAPCFGAGDGRWEYTDAAWLSHADAPAYFAKHREAISPPTLALARKLGWSNESQA